MFEPPWSPNENAGVLPLPNENAGAFPLPNENAGAFPNEKAGLDSPSVSEDAGLSCDVAK